MRLKIPGVYAVLRLLAVLFIMAAVTTAIGWAISYQWAFKFGRYSRPYDGAAMYSQEIWLRAGRIILGRNKWNRGGDAGVEYEFHRFDRSEDLSGEWDVEKTWLGFGSSFEYTPPDMNDSFLQVISVPCWFVTVAFALPAAALMWRRRKYRGGFCRSCGYDLRATTERCPECGTGMGRGNE